MRDASQADQQLRPRSRDHHDGPQPTMGHSSGRSCIEMTATDHMVVGVDGSERAPLR